MGIGHQGQAFLEVLVRHCRRVGMRVLWQAKNRRVPVTEAGVSLYGKSYIVSLVRCSGDASARRDWI